MDVTTSGIGGSELLSFALSLIVVVAAIVTFGWLYSRGRTVGRTNGVINVVASRALGTRERLLLVEIADKQLLVGMTASQVQTLHVFDKPIVNVTAKSESGGFASRLKSAVKGINL